MMKTTKMVCALAALLFFLSSAPLQASLITNGSFEADGAVSDGGSITGWTIDKPVGATTQVVSTFTFTDSALDDYTRTPEDGSYYALLKTDGPGNQNSLSQSFTADVGDVLSGKATFLDWETILSTFPDEASVDIFDENDQLVANLFYASGNPDGSTSGTTPWTSFSHTFTSAGNYTIVAFIQNNGDEEGDSYLGLDGFSVFDASGSGTIPEPVSFFTFGGLFTAFGFVGMRKNRKEKANK